MSSRVSILVLLAVLVTCAPVASRETVYVRNRAIPQPMVERGGDVFVPEATIVKLFKDGLETVSVDAAGVVTVNGAVTDMVAIKKGDGCYVPVLALARHLGWEIKRHTSLGIVDVVRPTSARLKSVALQNVEVKLDAGELARAERATAQVYSEFGPISKDEAMTRRVLEIGGRVASGSRPGVKWAFTVVASSEINACSVGAGRVFVTTGLLRVMDDAELAGVLAHEVAHDTYRHTSRQADEITLARLYMRQAEEARAEQARLEREYQSASGAFATNVEMRYRAAVQAEKEALARAEAMVEKLKKWKTVEGWEEEYEADRMGMKLLSAAGFHPLVMVSTLEKLLKMETAREPLRALAAEGTSTHPPLRDRVRIAHDVYRKFFERR